MKEGKQDHVPHEPHHPDDRKAPNRHAHDPRLHRPVLKGPTMDGFDDFILEIQCDEMIPECEDI